MGFRALFRQRGGGGDVIVVVLAVAGRTMLQQTVAPNKSYFSSASFLYKQTETQPLIRQVHRTHIGRKCHQQPTRIYGNYHHCRTQHNFSLSLKGGALNSASQDQ